MRCPHWEDTAFDRDGFDRDGFGRDGLDDTMRQHIDDCASCREQALRHDPTLLFRRLPSPEVGAEDITAMQQAVAAMRRADRVAQTAATTTRTAPTRRGRTWSAQLRAAVLAVALVGAAAGLSMPWERATQPATVASSVDAPTMGPAIDMEGAVESLAAETFDRGPLIENVEDFDELIQMAYDDHDVVVVFVDSKMETSNLDV